MNRFDLVSNAALKHALRAVNKRCPKQIDGRDCKCVAALPPFLRRVIPLFRRHEEFRGT